MRIETLERYRALREEADDLKNRLEALNGMCSPSLDGNPQHTNETHGLDELVLKREKLRRLYYKKLNKSRSLLIEIETFLDDVKDPETRTIIRHKYIDGMTWEDVGVAVKRDFSGCRKKVLQLFGKSTIHYDRKKVEETNSKNSK